MELSAFSVADRALRLKRRNLFKEISVAINEAKSEAGLTKEAFNDKKILFEQHWSKFVSDTEGVYKIV